MSAAQRDGRADRDRPDRPDGSDRPSGPGGPDGVNRLGGPDRPGGSDGPRRSPEAEQALRRHRHRQLQNVLLAMMIGATLLVITAWLVGMQLAGLEAVLVFQAALTPYLHVMRTTVLVGVVALWPRLIDRLADWLMLGPAPRHRLLAWRWQAALWMILMELVVVYEVPFTFLWRLLEVTP